MMRVLLGITVLCGGALLVGCPVYSNDRYCNGSGCYDCPAGTTPSGGTCIQLSCGPSNPCPDGYACDTSYSCVPAPVIEAGAGGCGYCPPPYVCKLAGGQATCSLSGPIDSGASDASYPDVHVDASFDASHADASAADAPASSDAPVDVADATPADAPAPSDAAPDAPTFVPCNANRDCGLDGSKCVDGRCTAQSALCSDTTQCDVAGEACVDGLCVPHCDATTPCPAGYACDFTHGVCDLNPTPCTGSGTSGCVGGSACVEGRCVAPCLATDAGPVCPANQSCVNGGCIPDEGAHFACKNDGQSGLLANVCTSADICLHHDCYVACDPEGGACADPSQTCKQVTVSSGTYAVCAAATNLGSDCDPATGAYCASGVCIDGYCK